MSDAFLVDTNVLSETTRPRPEARVLSWLKTQSPLYVSAVTLYELARGVHQMPAGRRRRFLEEWLAALMASAPEVVPFDGAAGLAAASIEAAARRSGHPISDRDLFILATARVRGLTLATHDLDDFRGHGVPLYDPFDDAHVPA